VPPLPADLPGVQRLAARASAVALYLLLILQPMLGLVGSMLHGDRIVVFGGILVPNLLGVSRPLARQVFQAHGVVASSLLALVCLHVAAALYHHFIRRDEVLSGMIPGLQAMRRSGQANPARQSNSSSAHSSTPHSSLPH
jgi:cytochrome b561